MTETASSGVTASPLLDSREVAAYLRVSESTLSRWRSLGSGPPFMRLGGIARYRVEAVDRWLAEIEQGHGEEADTAT